MRITRVLLVLVALLVLGAASALPASAKSGHHRSADRNRDRIPDKWEQRFHLSLKVDQANRNPDGDGLTNRKEYLAHTDPTDADTDNDGTTDGKEDAGTIVSFDGTTLVIKPFASPDPIKGTVTADTEIDCQTGAELDDEAIGDEHHHSAGVRTASDGPGDDDEGDDDEGDDDAQNGDDGQDSCPASALKPGAVVHEAELKATSTGLVFRQIELVGAPQPVK